MMSESCVDRDAALPEGGGRHHQHGGVHQPGDAHGDQDVDQLVAEDATLQRWRLHRDAVLGQRGVQVDHVRHHRGAEDAGGQQHALRALEAWLQDRLRRQAEIGFAEDRFHQVAEPDQRHEAGDHRFQWAEPEALQGQDAEGDHGREQRGREERDAEEQVQADCRAEELGEIGGNRHNLRQRPEHPRHRAAALPGGSPPAG